MLPSCVLGVAPVPGLAELTRGLLPAALQTWRFRVVQGASVDALRKLIGYFESHAPAPAALGAAWIESRSRWSARLLRADTVAALHRLLVPLVRSVRLARVRVKVKSQG